MATRNVIASGNWSAGLAVFDVVPVPGDVVSIGLDGGGDGYTLTYDFAAGDVSVDSIVLAAAAEGKTAAKLTTDTAAGSATLTITGSNGIYGTAGTVKGLVEFGTVASPLPYAAKRTIALGTAGTINGANLGVVSLVGTEPANPYVLLSADEAAGQTVLSVDRDVTSDLWEPGDVVAICDINKTQEYQRTTIAAGGIAATTITISDALAAAKSAGAYLVLVSRNLSVTIGGTNRAVQNAASPVLSCEIRQTSATVQGYGLDFCTSATVNGGTFSGNGYGLHYCTSATINGGTFSGNNYGLYWSDATILTDAVFSGNTQDVYLPGKVVGYGAALQSTTQVSNYLEGSSDGASGVHIYDVAATPGNPQNGRIRGWTPGGTVVSIEWASVPGGVQSGCPITPDYLHKFTFEAAARFNYFEWPLFGHTGVPITVTFYAQSQQAGMTARPTIAVCDPRKGYGAVGEELAATTADDDTDWQTLTLSYTPVQDGPLTLRVSAKNASGTSYWYLDLPVPVYPAESNTTTDETGYGPTGTEYAGSLNMSLYALISDIVSADYVVVGNDNYVGGSPGTYPTTATSQAAQLATDQGVVLAAAEYITTDVTDLLGTVDGTLDMSLYTPISGIVLPATDEVDGEVPFGYTGNMTEGTGVNAATILTALGLAEGNLDEQLAAVLAAGVGSGANTVTITVTDGADALESVKVRLTKGAESYMTTTDADGAGALNVDNGTWTLAAILPLYTYTSATLDGAAVVAGAVVVTGDHALVITMTAITIPASEPGLVTGYLYCYDEMGVVEKGVSVILKLAEYPATGSGKAFDTAERTAASAADGLVSFTGMFPGATYTAKRGNGTAWSRFTVPADQTDPYAIPYLIGAP